MAKKKPRPERTLDLNDMCELEAHPERVAELDPESRKQYDDWMETFARQGEKFREELSQIPPFGGMFGVRRDAVERKLEPVEFVKPAIEQWAELQLERERQAAETPAAEPPKREPNPILIKFRRLCKENRISIDEWARERGFSESQFRRWRRNGGYPGNGVGADMSVAYEKAILEYEKEVERKRKEPPSRPKKAF